MLEPKLQHMINLKLRRYLEVGEKARRAFETISYSEMVTTEVVSSI